MRGRATTTPTRRSSRPSRSPSRTASTRWSSIPCPPRNAFKHVFENGADFSLTGMFDFEIAEDVKIATEVLAGIKQRARPWRG